MLLNVVQVEVQLEETLFLLVILQYASCASSLLSLAYSVTAYQIAVYNSNTVISRRFHWRHLLAAVIYLLWKALILTSRLSALTYLAVCLRYHPHHPWIFCASLFLHWFLAFIALIHENLNSCRLLEVVFVAALAVVHCFDVALLNMRRRRQSQSVGLVYALWYGVFLVENIVATAAAAATASLSFQEEGRLPMKPNGVAALGLVITTFALGMACMFIYYGFAYHKWLG